MPPRQTHTRTMLDNTTGAIEMPVAQSSVDANNPANSPEQRVERYTEARKRIPMSTPTRKLETPELPGFHLHWIVGEPDRVAKATRAGYTFVQKHEMPGYLLELGEQTGVSGNTDDLGDSRISTVAGGVGTDGQALRLYLMKLPQELHEEDIAARDEQGQETLNALRGDPNAQGKSGQDNSHRYIPNMGAKTERPPANRSFNALDQFRKR